MSNTDGDRAIPRAFAPEAKTELTSGTQGRLRSTAGVLAQAFAHVDAQARVRLLSRLLRAVGPLALAVIGGGAFFRFVWATRGVTVDDVARVTPMQVFELASYVQQSNPAAVDQALAMLPQDVASLTALGASAVAIGIGMASRYVRKRQ